MARRRNLATIATVLIALSLGSVITDRLPKPEDVRSEPKVHEVAVGEAAPMRTGTFVVTALDASPVITAHGTANRSSGTYLVVTVEFTAAKEPAYVPSDDTVLLAADGREYGSGAAAGGACGSQPGLTMVCQIPIEVEPSALAGAQLRLPAQGTPVFGPPVMEEAHVDLGLTEAKAAELAAKTDPIFLKPSQPKGA